VDRRGFRLASAGQKKDCPSTCLGRRRRKGITLNVAEKQVQENWGQGSCLGGRNAAACERRSIPWWNVNDRGAKTRGMLQATGLILENRVETGRPEKAGAWGGRGGRGTSHRGVADALATAAGEGLSTTRHVKAGGRSHEPPP